MARTPGIAYHVNTWSGTNRNLKSSADPERWAGPSRRTCFTSTGAGRQQPLGNKGLRFQGIGRQVGNRECPGNRINPSLIREGRTTETQLIGSYLHCAGG